MNYKPAILMIRKREGFSLNIILQQKDTPMSHDRKKKKKNGGYCQLGVQEFFTSIGSINHDF